MFMVKQFYLPLFTKKIEIIGKISRRAWQGKIFCPRWGLPSVKSAVYGLGHRVPSYVDYEEGGNDIRFFASSQHILIFVIFCESSADLYTYTDVE